MRKFGCCAAEAEDAVHDAWIQDLGGVPSIKHAAWQLLNTRRKRVVQLAHDPEPEYDIHAELEYRSALRGVIGALGEGELKLLLEERKGRPSTTVAGAIARARHRALAAAGVEVAP